MSHIPFHRQLLRISRFARLGIVALLIFWQVLEHFVIRRERLTPIFFYEILVTAFIVTSVWIALTWTSRQVIRHVAVPGWLHSTPLTARAVHALLPEQTRRQMCRLRTLLRKEARAVDAVARCGGEEYAGATG